MYWLEDAPVPSGFSRIAKNLFPPGTEYLSLLGRSLAIPKAVSTDFINFYFLESFSSGYESGRRVERVGK